MICGPCREGGDGHARCVARQGVDPMAETPREARTWCDCQHKRRPVEKYDTPGGLTAATLVVQMTPAEPATTLTRAEITARVAATGEKADGRRRG